MYTPEEILSKYNIKSTTPLTPLTGGIIHRTWRVDADNGKFILQKVSPTFAPAVMEDIEAVLEYLKGRGFTVMSIVKTTDGELFVDDENGFWRVFTCIEGKTYAEVTDPAVAYEAGKMLGSYHRALADFKYEFKHIRTTKFNIPALFDAYKNAVAKNTDPEITAMIPLIDRMIEINLPATLRKTVNHGDPKISNFIFSDGPSPHAITMVDLDDCGKNYNVLYELGSAFRSWSWRQETSKSSFDMTQFEAGLHGYAEGSDDFLTDEEWALIPRTIQLNLLQGLSRFVRDYFEDSYFEWDPKQYASRKEHNLARAKEYIELYQEIVNKEKEIAAIAMKIKGASIKSS